jgi:hypothetical protein
MSGVSTPSRKVLGYSRVLFWARPRQQVLPGSKITITLNGSAYGTAAPAAEIFIETLRATKPQNIVLHGGFLRLRPLSTRSTRSLPAARNSSGANKWPRGT